MSEDWLNFLKENYFVLFYFVALIIALASYRKYFDTALKYFPIIIAYTFFNELLGYFIRFNEAFALVAEQHFANDVLYNLYYVIFFGFFYRVYYSLIKSTKFKKWIVICASMVTISFITSAFFQNPLTTMLFYATSIAAWGLLFCILLYFLDKGEWDWNKEKYNLVFWVSTGLAIFYFFFPILFWIGFFKYEVWQQYHLRTVLRMLIVVMYGLFSIGFMLSRRRAFR